ncbi:hypothetical protein OE88DRAFT_1732589 [Heliocybe sulcata]|uniref:Uncharacterized protein n=1 Tax=Heliocybe sulcata TaxID=5364 RepID=A0A5C3NFU5_9AGAM|nr:hypothetical protein OE88DRAFT_1732589 [Heliocybe sulcata]
MFKGGHDIPSYQQTFIITVVIGVEQVFMDLPAAIIIIGLHRGDFQDYSTCAELRMGEEVEITQKQDVMDVPFFCPSMSGGWGLFMQTICEKCSLGSAEVGSVPYCF